VIAIIAMLMSMLLPSLGHARAQGRTTLCATRISQLGKAVLIYADDHNETPPFLGRGWEDAPPNGEDNAVWPSFPGSKIKIRDWKYLEDWLMPRMPDYWTKAQKDWPNHAHVRNGSLFHYSRFEAVYRCPEFERVTDTRKSQNAFNYTRTILGRTWYHAAEPESKPGSPWCCYNWAGAAGPVVTIGRVYAPSQLHMLIGERWDRHCAASPDEFSPPADTAKKGFLKGWVYGQWMVADPMLCAFGDEVGQYHGQRVPSQIALPELRDLMEAVKRENAVFYDGHAALESDPLPDRYIDLSWGIGNAMQLMDRFVRWAVAHIFAQRGLGEVVVD
jgi:type II secretory pathway pseudopilin PulG